MGEILKDFSNVVLADANEANMYAYSTFSYNLPEADAHQGQDISWCITDMPLLHCNVVFRARLNPEHIDHTIESLVEKAKRRNVPLRWLIGKDTEPTNLGEHLISHGFTTSGSTPLMAIDLLSLIKNTPPTNLTIFEVKDNTKLETWCRIAIEGFGLPPERSPAMLRWVKIALAGC